MSDALQVERVSASRRGRQVLDMVSFQIDPGEIVAVIGPNGAGKTSLLEAVLGILPLTSGTVSFQGRPLRSLRDRARIFSFLSEDAEPPEEVRVAALLNAAARAAPRSEDLAYPLEEQLGLRPLRRAFAGELSRGEKRRVLLFTALCTDRPVIVLDEPLGVFDPLQLIQVRGLLQQRVRTGARLLLSIHHMAEAERIASRILLLDGGQRVAFGSLLDLRAQTQRPDASLEDVFVSLLRRAHGTAAA
jgi:ABC-type multidrug transport system ATPase subunit